MGVAGRDVWIEDNPILACDPAVLKFSMMGGELARRGARVFFEHVTKMRRVLPAEAAGQVTDLGTVGEQQGVLYLFEFEHHLKLMGRLAKVRFEDGDQVSRTHMEPGRQILNLDPFRQTLTHDTHRRKGKKRTLVLRRARPTHQMYKELG